MKESNVPKNQQKSSGTGLDAIQPARDIMDKVVGFAPQAAVPWAGICLGLEVCFVG